MEKHILSKSTFMAGVQCEKRFYLTKKGSQFGINPDDVTPQQQAVFDTGTSVGELAQKLYPGGIDCTPSDFRNFSPSIEQTNKLIADGHTVIYEAAFQHDKVLAALDILVKKEDGWHAYEVKSTNSAKPQHVQDAAVQYWVISNSGIDLQSISILHFDKEYVKRGDIDMQALFSATDVTDQVEEILPTIRPQVKALKMVVEKPEIPAVDIGPHCGSPYPCNFKGHCWKNVQDYSVLNLTNARGKQWDLYQQGVEKVADIPDDYPLNGNQRMQVQADRTGESFIDKEVLGHFISEIQYPIYFMDFETIQPAVPIYDESRPYQMAVFQYSVHIQQEKGGPVEHREFLANPADKDLRRTVAQRLIEDMGTTGTVLVYNNSFEGPRLRELARDYPDLSNQILAISARIIDLAVPFRQKNYYTAEMHGRFSIKKVLPALVPELSYQDLEIQEGGTASHTFLEMVQGKFDGDTDATRAALIEYCKLDTFAMVKLLEKLIEVTQ